MQRISSKTIWLQHALAMERGAPASLLTDLGVEEARLLDPEYTLDAETVYDHVEAIYDFFGEAAWPEFCVELAARHETTTLGLPGFAMRTAPTIREGLTVMLRYQHLTNTLAVFELVEHDTLAIWSEHRHGTPRLGSLLSTEISVHTAVAVAREMAGGNFVATQLSIRREGVDTGPYERFSGARVIQGTPRGSMTFERTLLDRSMSSANEDMRAYFDAELQRREREHEATPLVLRDLRRVLTAHLLEGMPSIAAAAKALSVSTRTLQRKLANEQTNFAEVLDSLRHDLALVYIMNPRHSATDVAFLLGYSEASPFYRAFKRWTGNTPEEYRNPQGS